jgi:TRAP-type C4-dicarboxylate transport system permease small subunit
MRIITQLVSSLAGTVDKVVNRILALFIGVMTLVIFTQVMLRYLANFSLSWSEELCRFMSLWVIFGGLPVLLHRGGMTAFDIISTKLKGWKARAVAVIISVGLLVFLYFLLVGTYPLMLRQFRQTATTLPIPIGLVYMIMPISAVLSVLMVCEYALKVWASTKAGS